MSGVLLIFSVLLAICAAQSRDPLVWASIEAQGAYIIGEGVGKKCSPIPNSFQMRADGAWDPASEFDLTGDFDDDCGIHITLSIPGEETEKGIEEKKKEEEEERKRKEQEKEQEKEKLKETLAKERNRLEEKKKTINELEVQLEKEKTAHEDDVKSFEKNKEKLRKTKEEIEEEKGKVKTDEDKVSTKKMNLEDKKKLIKDMEDKLKLMRDEHEKKKKDYEDQHEALKKRNISLKEDIANNAEKKRLLREMYDRCEKFTTYMKMKYAEIQPPTRSGTMWYCSTNNAKRYDD